MNKNTRIILQTLFLLFLVAGSYFAVTNRTGLQKTVPFQQTEDMVFGTVMHATYQYDRDLHDEIMEALREVDGSLSMFNPNSTLAKINRDEEDQADSLVQVVFAIAQQISQATDGAFDVTVAPLVNAWGFGFKNGALPDSLQVDSLLQQVGWESIRITDGRVIKDKPNMVMDMSAVAKGFGSDHVAEMFRRHGISNFMIEIGGEIVTSGNNSKGKPWKIGINKPIEDSTQQNNEVQHILEVNDRAMATSGNYRNFYITEDGRKLAHTIDPKTGRPVQHSILSSTVLAPTCAIADGFATAFMVMGLERAQQVLKEHPELQVYFIYSDNEGKMKTWTNIELN